MGVGNDHQLLLVIKVGNYQPPCSWKWLSINKLGLQ